MEAFRPTLAIYGIQDIKQEPYPALIHDHNMALWENGRVVKYLHLERITRNKHDQQLPARIYQLLKDEGLAKPDDYDIVFADHFIGRSFLSSQGNLRLEGNWSTTLQSVPEPARAYWLGTQRKAWVVNHELSHVYSSMPFYGVWTNNSLHFQFDGGASLGNYSLWHYIDGSLRLLDFGWRLKYLSGLFNANALTFAIIGAGIKEQNSVPGKFMGFASLGKPRTDILEWLKVNDFFQHHWKRPIRILEQASRLFTNVPSDFDQRNAFLQDVAATIQNYFEEEVLAFLALFQAKVKAEDLYFSGGSALNIKLNRRIASKGLFTRLYVPPATNDSGLSLGAGAALETLKGNMVLPHQPGMNNWGIESYQKDIGCSREVLAEVASLLAQGKVIAVCNGYGEAGPRALGHRSILARPDNPELARKVSCVHKQREWYRPIAPIMLEKYLPYFTKEFAQRDLAKFMLTDFNIRQDKRNELAGVVHVDGTARIQIVDKSGGHLFMYDLLSVLAASYDVKALINTSFNRRGEPIVHTYDDAIKSARKMKLDAVVLGGKLKRLEY